MIKKIPCLVSFTKAYWNQLGPDVYGSIEAAFGQMLSDARRSKDAGGALRLNLRRELMSIYQSSEYEMWLKSARRDPDAIDRVGGAFIFPEDVPVLLQKLESNGQRPI